VCASPVTVGAFIVVACSVPDVCWFATFWAIARCCVWGVEVIHSGNNQKGSQPMLIMFSAWTCRSACDQSYQRIAISSIFIECPNKKMSTFSCSDEIIKFLKFSIDLTYTTSIYLSGCCSGTSPRLGCKNKTTYTTCQQLFLKYSPLFCHCICNALISAAALFPAICARR